jgi:5-methyltetrahydropteroyltriglutamate--homocysteine methyltransferase
LRRNVDLVVSAIILWNTTHLECAIGRTIEQFESTGSPVITDGEQRKYHNFATYCVEGLPNTAPDGFKLLFADGHARRWPRLTSGPFRFVLSFYPSIRE